MKKNIKSLSHLYSYTKALKLIIFTCIKHILDL